MSYETTRIVGTALTGIFTVPLFIIWFISLCIVRRRGDPARVGFAWLKLVLPLMAISLALYVVSSSVAIYLDSSGFNGSYLPLLQVNARCDATGFLFMRSADVALIITLAELGIGFLYALSRTQDGLQKAVRYGVCACGAVMFILVIASFGLLQSIWSKYFDYIHHDRYSNIDFDAAIKLTCAVDIMLWLLCLPLLAFASFVVHKVKTQPLLGGSAIVFLIATILDFIRHFWRLIGTALWQLPSRASPTYIGIVDPLLNIWPCFVLLVMLFVLGVRRRAGLWTTQQKWMNVAPVFVPAFQPQPGQGPWGPQAGVQPPPQMAFQPHSNVQELHPNTTQELHHYSQPQELPPQYQYPASPYTGQPQGQQYGAQIVPVQQAQAPYEPTELK